MANSENFKQKTTQSEDSDTEQLEMQCKTSVSKSRYGIGYRNALNDLKDRVKPL